MIALGAERREGEVLENRALGRGGFLMTVAMDGPAQAYSPGQFLMVKAWEGVDPLLRRPLAPWDVRIGRDGRTEIDLLYAPFGRGTLLLSRLATGARLSAVGPLGRGFRRPAPGGLNLYVAGGVGIAPFYFLARQAKESPGVEQALVLGAREKALLLGMEEFAALGVPVRVTTDKGDHGRKGVVTEELRAIIEERGRGAIASIYACGPRPMLRAVLKLACDAGIPGEVSLEERMACGFGACVSCVVPARDVAGGEVRNVKTCLEGPVLPVERLAGLLD